MATTMTANLLWHCKYHRTIDFTFEVANCMSSPFLYQIKVNKKTKGKIQILGAELKLSG